MKRIVTWLLSTFSVVVLLFGYHTSTSATLASGSGQTPVTASGASTAGSTGSGSRSGSASHNAAKPTTVTGSTSHTQWGPVQVQITTSGGSITDVAVLQYPTGNSTDEEINSYALPILTQSTIDAQSAQIDMVSGATVTSVGYRESLQSALDQAGL